MRAILILSVTGEMFTGMILALGKKTEKKNVFMDVQKVHVMLHHAETMTGTDMWMKSAVGMTATTHTNRSTQGLLKYVIQLMKIAIL